MKKYTAKFFRDSMPEWKKKKDPLIAQLLYRPLSFSLSAFCANKGISANSVSFCSILFGILACVCFFIPNWEFHIFGAVIVNIWLLFDCVDGNIARSVKSQPFGEFADATSCYILLAFLYPAMGFAIYIDGGLLFESGNVLIILIGALASCTDVVARLIQQKFIVGKMELFINQKLSELGTGSTHKNPSGIDIIAEALGIGGYLPMLILLGTITYSLDIVLFYCFMMSFGLFVWSCYSNIKHAVRIASELDSSYHP